MKRERDWTGFGSNISYARNNDCLTSDFACVWRNKGSRFQHDNCNKAKRLVRLVDSVRDSRSSGGFLRIGFCRSNKERRNLEADP